jgi:hypothetical protein
MLRQTEKDFHQTHPESCKSSQWNDPNICSPCAWSYIQETHTGWSKKGDYDCYKGADSASTHNQKHA